MSDQPTVPLPLPRDRFARIKIAFGLQADPSGRPPFIWAERINAWVFAFLILVGVPLLGYSDWPTGIKLIIMGFWFGIFPIYFLLEMREITGQMEGRGSIDSPQARRQIRTAQVPHIATILSIVVWVVSWAYFHDRPGGSPIRYGWIEWAIIVHAFLAILITNYSVYGLLMELLKSAPRGERVERKLP